MKKTGKTFKKYTALALALAIVSPITAFASEVTNNDREVEISESIEQKEAYQKSVKASLSEDGKKISYDINITKDENTKGNLFAYIYLLGNSNIENLSLAEESSHLENQVVDTDLGKAIKVDLKDASNANIKLTADIKEEKTDNLYFDLVLVSDQDYKDHSRVGGKIVNGQIQEVESDVKSLGLSGSLVDEKTISWKDLLVNNTKEELKTDYNLSLSSNQAVDGQKLNIEFFELTNEGYKISQNETFELGSIKDLVLAPNTLVRLSFTTKALESTDDYQINDAIVTNTSSKLKEDQANTKVLSEENSKEEQAKDLTKELNSTKEKIKDTLVENEKELNQDSQKSLEKTDQANTKASSFERSKEEQAKDLTNELNSTTDQVKETLVENEKELSGQSEEQSPEKTQTVIREVKTVALPIKENLENLSKEDQAKALTAKINSINDEIKAVLIENEASLPDTIMNQEKQASPVLNNEKELSAKELVEKLNNTKSEIETTLKSVVSAEQYNNLIAYQSSSKEEQAKTLIESLNNTSKQILEVLRQVELGVEADHLLENPTEIAKISALLDDIDQIDENTKKAIKENQEQNKDYVSPHFEIVKDDFSKEVYKKLENVVTVTLDPLEKTNTSVARDQIKKEYPSIAHYLENIELRSDLLDSLK